MHPTGTGSFLLLFNSMQHHIAIYFFQRNKRPAEERRLKNRKLPVLPALKGMRHWQDAEAGLLGESLFLQGMADLGIKNGISGAAGTSPGLPALKMGTASDIAYSRQFIACVISRHCTVGIDVALIESLDMTAYQSFFRQDEWHFIQSSPDPLRTFFACRSIKTAVANADGRRQRIAPRDIQIHPGFAVLHNRLFYYRHISLSPFHSTVVAFDIPRPVIACKDLTHTLETRGWDEPGRITGTLPMV